MHSLGCLDNADPRSRVRSQWDQLFSYLNDNEYSMYPISTKSSKLKTLKTIEKYKIKYTDVRNINVQELSTQSVEVFCKFMGCHNTRVNKNILSILEGDLHKWFSTWLELKEKSIQHVVDKCNQQTSGGSCDYPFIRFMSTLPILPTFFKDTSPLFRVTKIVIGCNKIAKYYRECLIHPDYVVKCCQNVKPYDFHHISERIFQLLEGESSARHVIRGTIEVLTCFRETLHPGVSQWIKLWKKKEKKHLLQLWPSYVNNKDDLFLGIKVNVGWNAFFLIECAFDLFGMMIVKWRRFRHGQEIATWLQRIIQIHFENMEAGHVPYSSISCFLEFFGFLLR